MKLFNFFKSKTNAFTVTDFEYHYSVLLKNIEKQTEAGEEIDVEVSKFIINLLLYRILYKFTALIYQGLIFAIIFNLCCDTHLFYENNWINFGIAFAISLIKSGISYSMMKLFYANCNIKTG
jgi:hypothetical protein